MRSLVYTLIMVFSFYGLEGQEKIKKSDLIGKWKLSESFVSAGGGKHWVTATDGDEYEFFDDGTFSSSKYSECTTGVFFIDESTLFLEYKCDGFESNFENKKGYITYTLKFESDSFIATPTSGPICTEGCSYKYIKE